MTINEQLYEDIFNDKTTGDFVLRNGTRVNSSRLKLTTVMHKLGNHYVKPDGAAVPYAPEYDIVDFIPYFQQTSPFTL